MLDLRNKTITVVGAKRSGIALVKLICHRGGIAKLTDSAGEEILPEAFRNFIKKRHIKTEFNGHNREFIQDSDIVVLSPGVPFNAPPVLWAREKGVPVVGEIEFAAEFCPAPIIAVTGSNGKTTTVTLMHEVLKAAGFRSSLCGNVGYPFSECIAEIENKDYVVLEVSSFQMEAVLDPEGEFRKYPGKNGVVFKGFKPKIAMILNFSQNHLDRHKDMDDYMQAKRRIFINQGKEDVALLNDRDPQTPVLEKFVQSRLMRFDAPGDAQRYGVSNPNYLAVLEAAKVLEIDVDICRRVFGEFKGVEHRLEKVRMLEGVHYVNDSKSTTIESGRWALNNFTQPVVLICGGKDKNLDFSVLRSLVKNNVKTMILIGEARGKICKVFDGLVPIQEADSLEDAVARARDIAVAGEYVLLSPMCASFDMFNDYEHRGRCFKEIVMKLSPREKVQK